MAREIYKRTKSGKRQHAKCAVNSGAYKTMSGRLDLFSRMSMEAMQAIDETRQEMRQESPEANSPGLEEFDIKAPDINDAEEAGEANDASDESVRIKDPITDDNDSAIGTCSLKSHPVSNHDSDSINNNPQESSENKPKHTERIRSTTVCSQRLFNDKNIKQRFEFLQKRYQSSQWIRDCISRHTPSPGPTQSKKKLNVFERLSAPTQISYKISARQRSRARLSLSLNNDRHDLTTFSQTRHDLPKLSKSATVLPRTPVDGKPPAPKRELTTITSHRLSTSINKPHQPNSGVSKPTISTATNKVTISSHPAANSPKVVEVENEMRSVARADERVDIDDVSYKSLRAHELQRSRPFEITPLGYDSRYAALKYDSQLPYSTSDLDDCEIIRQSKIKCRQWLAQQMAVLTRS